MAKMLKDTMYEQIKDWLQKRRFGVYLEAEEDEPFTIKISYKEIDELTEKLCEFWQEDFLKKICQKLEEKTKE